MKIVISILVVFCVPVLAWADPDVPGANRATAEYNGYTGELKISSAGATKVLVHSASSGLTPLDPAPTPPVGVLINSASQIGITNLGPISLSNYSLGSVWDSLACSDLKLVYTPALGQKGIEVAAGSGGFWCVGPKNPVEPLAPLSNHHNENHSKHDHHGEDLHGIDFSSARLVETNFSDSDLTDTILSGAMIANAMFDGAKVTGANFGKSSPIVSSPSGPAIGFTKEQLYSTASYQAKDLQRIGLAGLNLTGWDFSGQNLKLSQFGSFLLGTSSADLSDAKLAGANLTFANLSEVPLTNADLAGALITGADFTGFTSQGLTKEQLYSTASYQQRELQGIKLGLTNQSGWDFSGQNLTNAILGTLTNANLSGATVTGASLGGIGLTKEQLYSTASYQAKNLQGVRLSDDLSGWDFSGQNLASSNLSYATLTNANLTGANLANAYLYSFAPMLDHADFSGADLRGVQGDSFVGAILTNTILPNGTIAGLDLHASDRLVVRNHPAHIIIIDHTTIAADGTLNLQFDSNRWTSLIGFQTGHSVSLVGNLELTFANGVDTTTQVGRTLRIFDWTGVTPTGQFQITSPYQWDTSKLYSTGEVTLMAVPETVQPRPHGHGDYMPSGNASKELVAHATGYHAC